LPEHLIPNAPYAPGQLSNWAKNLQKPLMQAFFILLLPPLLLEFLLDTGGGKTTENEVAIFATPFFILNFKF